MCVCVYTYEYGRSRGGQMGGDDVEADVTTSVLKGEGKNRGCDFNFGGKKNRTTIWFKRPV